MYSASKSVCQRLQISSWSGQERKTFDVNSPSAWTSAEVTTVDKFPALMTIWLADEVSTAISLSAWLTNEDASMVRLSGEVTPDTKNNPSTFASQK